MCTGWLFSPKRQFAYVSLPRRQSLSHQSNDYSQINAIVLRGYIFQKLLLA